MEDESVKRCETHGFKLPPWAPDSPRSRTAAVTYALILVSTLLAAPACDLMAYGIWPPDLDDVGVDGDRCDAIIADESLFCNAFRDLTVDSDTSWSAGCSTYGDLIVDGAVLTVLVDPDVGPTTVIADTVNITATAVIDLDGQGYPSREGPGPGLLVGTGPYGAGAGHGGKGGAYGDVDGGVAYGDPFYPVTSGSGSGNAGGGAIRICARESLTVDGILRATGESASSGGGAAGGSILLISPIIDGEGSLQAQGGTNTAIVCGGQGAGGGGGRVALLAATDDFEGDIDVSRGAACPGLFGNDGTVHRGGLP